MFSMSALAGIFCMVLVDYHKLFRISGLLRELEKIFYFILGFFIASCIVYYRVIFKFRRNNKDEKSE